MASRREGQNLGPYRLIEQIGEGGMATVYKAYQPSMERHVAVKILPPHYADDPQFAERFLREARTIAKLEHLNILPVYDFGEEKDTAYLVMRYLEGGTLKNVMKQGRLSLSDIERIFSQICSALDYAHRKGVIHRDVKPANVMIDTEGAAFLTDFGIAKVLTGVSQLTATGAAIGTPTYMAPEQSLAKSVDARSDTYSLGVILYEMVVGKVPYEADTPMAVALAHIHEPLPMPTELDPGIPESIEAVIIKAMAKEPDDRYQTARELASALQVAIREAVAAQPEPTEATLVDLVTEARTAELEKATRVAEEAVPKEEELIVVEPVEEVTAAAETVSEEPVLEGPPTKVEEPPTVLEPVPDAQATEAAAETPIHEVQAVEEALELPPLDHVPRKPLPVRTITMVGGGLAIVALVVVGVTSGLFGGGDEVPEVSEDARPALAIAEQATPTRTLQPTNTPTTTRTPRPPTPTPTPLSTTDSGLTIFDDFNVEDGKVDTVRWGGGDPFYKIEDGVLALRVGHGDEPEEVVQPYSKVNWIPRRSGPTRFSIGTKMFFHSHESPNAYWDSALLLLSSANHRFTVEVAFQPPNTSPLITCYMDNDKVTSPKIIRGPWTTYDAWHDIRIDIQEELFGDGLVVVGYVDGKKICTLTPESEWQLTIAQGKSQSLGITSWWNPDLDPNKDEHYEIWFDDVAVWPMSTPSTMPPTSESGLNIFDDFNDTEGAMDDDRWENPSFPFWTVGGDSLTFKVSEGDSTNSHNWVSSIPGWRPRRSGSIRFSVELKLWFPSDNRYSQTVNQASLFLLGPTGTNINVQIGAVIGPNEPLPGSYCNLYNPDRIPNSGRSGPSVSLDAWHALRWDIQENNSGDGLVVNGYLDGRKICTYTPESVWQDAVSKGRKLSIALSIHWDKPWPMERDLTFRFDDIAVWPPLEE